MAAQVLQVFVLGQSKKTHQVERKESEVKTDLVVDESPLLQECVNTHDSTDVTCKVSSARGDSEILCRSESVRIDHEVAIILVD
jgi:hypothetical protein